MWHFSALVNRNSGGHGLTFMSCHAWQNSHRLMKVVIHEGSAAILGTSIVYTHYICSVLTRSNSIMVL